jgi:hypothetical protein
MILARGQIARFSRPISILMRSRFAASSAAGPACMTRLPSRTYHGRIVLYVYRYFEASDGLDVPLRVVTVTSTVPVPDGLVALIVVSPSFFASEAGTKPNGVIQLGSAYRAIANALSANTRLPSQIPGFALLLPERFSQTPC